MKKANKVASVKKSEYVICRGYRRGVHAGEFVSDKAGWITLHNARRIWHWEGAASLSEIAVYGCNKERGLQSRIAAVVETIRLRAEDICEVIVCVGAGEDWLRRAAEWRA